VHHKSPDSGERQYSSRACNRRFDAILKAGGGLTACREQVQGLEEDEGLLSGYQRGYQRLKSPARSSSLATPLAARARLGLRGLLPGGLVSLDVQVMGRAVPESFMLASVGPDSRGRVQ